MRTVTAAYAKSNLSELLALVAGGERVTISRYNKPVADLVPFRRGEQPIPKLGTGKGKIKMLDPNWADPMTDDEVDAFIRGEFSTNLPRVLLDKQGLRSPVRAVPRFPLIW